MNILFISRAFPPVVGGIENQNFALSVWLKRFASITTVANRHGKMMLPFFFPLATFRALFSASQYDVILLGDGVLAVVGFVIKKFCPHKTVVSIVHGLDLTYSNNLYQTWWVQRFLPSLDGLIAVSEETRLVALAKNIPEENITVIPNGVEPDTLRKKYSRTDLEKFLGKDLSHSQVLLTAGRLTKRKGAVWFIENVLPQLSSSTLYLLAGSGSEEENIRTAIKKTHTEEQVLLLGRVTNTERNLLLNTVDIFIQPNIRVPGDMEGFGIAAIEATACGRPVIASNLEGLKDAIKHNESGLLIEPGDAKAFTAAINYLIANEQERLLLGEKALHYTETHYHWNIMARLYVEALEIFHKKEK